MPRIERTAEAVWEGNVARGSGSLAARSSGAFELSYSLPARIGAPGGKTSPEELVAAAHAGCFAMALASELTQMDNPPGRLEVTATCVMDEVEGKGHLVIGSQLDVTAHVPGLARATFDEALAKADAGCPISTLIRGSAEVSVSARLEA